MSNVKIASLFRPSARFMRSIQLERDFLDSQALSGYILTNHSLESLTRIASGLRKNSSQRAWRITGNYGAGKSNFALLLAHWLAGEARSIPLSIRAELSYRKFASVKPRLVPVLITGSRVSMTEAISRSLMHSLEHLYVGRKKPRIVSDFITSVIYKNQQLSENRLADALTAITNRIVTDGLGSGLLLIIDELGKFLEFATLHPERQDIYLLQRLAEIAARSGDKPIFIVSLLHQGFNAYAHNLSEVAQREWEKVAARFEEIIFSQPLEQIATLISYALNSNTKSLPKSVEKGAKLAMEKAVALGWFGASHVKSILLQNAPKIYPLHPTVLPILARVFKRFGQNERSLFSFLLSNEPFGLQAFSQRPLKVGEFYRLHDLYEYVRISFGHRLAIQSYRSHWNQIDSMIQSYMTDSPAELELLRTVGILNLLDTNDLVPTEDAIILSLSRAQASQQSVRASISKLHSQKNILYSRGAAGGYCLWPYTSVNLEIAYENATKAVPLAIRVTDKISKYVESTPIVARRHYITTGNLRYFTLSYLPVAEVTSILKTDSIDADGLIIVVLCETEQERQEALTIARSRQAANRHRIIVAIPPPLNNLAGLIAEVERWEWVSRNTPELANDRFATEEVSRQKKATLTALERRLQAFVGLHHFHGETSLECYYREKKLSILAARDLLRQLSRICDEIYPCAPHVQNELVNRRFLSAAASAARMRLIERMLTHFDVERLGMDETKKPPEMSIYLSVLKASNIHRSRKGVWQIAKPPSNSDPCNMIPAWECIESVLKDVADRKVPLVDLFNTLHRPPYGLRDGLIPILLAAFIVANEDKVALYERGSFLPVVQGEEFMRLTKAPDIFELQYCNIEGIRTELLQKLQEVVAGDKEATEKPAVLELVRPLCVFVARLPDHSRVTKKMSPVSINVRQAILSARDPFSLLFTDLPMACDVPAIKRSKSNNSDKDTNKFIKELKRSIAEMRMAYPHLLERIHDSVRIAFDLSPKNKDLRSELSARSEKILMGLTEPRLKAFCIRLSDDRLRDSDWLESIGSYLASRPPAKWHDSDEETFVHELSLLAARFRRQESLVFQLGDSNSGSIGMRMMLTRSDGREYDRVVYFDDVECEEIIKLQKTFEKLLAENKDIGIEAASHALWKKLSNDDNRS